VHQLTSTRRLKEKRKIFAFTLDEPNATISRGSLQIDDALLAITEE